LLSLFLFFSGFLELIIDLLPPLLHSSYLLVFHGDFTHVISYIQNAPEHLSLVILHISIIRFLSFPFLESRRHRNTNLSSHLVVKFRVELLISHVDGVNIFPKWLEITSGEEILNAVVGEEKVYYFLGLRQK
tara:strand:- start:936 stop:1331 length:396 start_codon:yes stop_codon:yes gene_type:complete